jgi:hypothetical protein
LLNVGGAKSRIAALLQGCETGLALTLEWWPMARSVQPFQVALPKCSTVGR